MRFRLSVPAALACSLACSLAVPAMAETLSVGPNVNITKATGNQSETAITINPTNPQNLFAFSNGMTAAYSTNGGQTWSKSVSGLTSLWCDPTLTADEYGNLFAGYMSSSGSNVAVGYSTNGGQSFTLLNHIGTSSSDQPTIVAGAGSLWATFRDDGAGGLVAYQAPVTGKGQVGQFGTVMAIPGTSSDGSFGDIAIGPGGKVAVAYQSPTGNQGPANIYVNVKQANASGFGNQILATSTNVGGWDYIPAQPNRSIDAEAGLAWDRTGGPRNNRLYMVYTDENPNESGNTDVYVRYSDNDGATWSTAKKVNDDTTTRSQFFSKIAIDPVTGNIAVVWYDCRNDSGNVKTELWGSVSLDGGNTFLPNVKISAGQSSYAVDTSMNYGDYLGLTFYNNVFYPAWADSSNSTGDNPDGKMEMYAAAVSVVGVPEPASLTLLGLGGILLTTRRRAGSPKVG